MLTFEEIKEMAKKFAMERANADNVWYCGKEGSWYFFLYKKSKLPRYTGFPMGLRININGSTERIIDLGARSKMMDNMTKI